MTRPRYNGPCVVCGTQEDYQGRYIKKMCKNCYGRMITTGNSVPKAPYHGPCIACGSMEAGTGGYFRRKLCRSCYDKAAHREAHPLETRICEGCGKTLYPGKKVIRRTKCSACLKRERYQRIPEVVKRVNKRYSQSKKGRTTSTAATRRRRAKVQAAPGSLSTQEWREILSRHGYACFYCGSAKRITMDHYIPLSRGGSHTADNIVPACSACNYSKGYRLVSEWAQHPLTEPFSPWA